MSDGKELIYASKHIIFSISQLLLSNSVPNNIFLFFEHFFKVVPDFLSIRSQLLPFPYAFKVSSSSR